ncbi:MULTISPECIES: hypothetical protein [unclassified Luteibacter]|uniref:hypothetical protein n=1 Tax=unclassified Luteibacter TaxID=2620188 RepID=UPI0005BE8336|nr:MULTISPECIES: hypothetical protein [unclassified Luteibacter]MDR6644513.1 hypothetical protein [Luteibacter sp. 1214]
MTGKEQENLMKRLSLYLLFFVLGASFGMLLCWYASPVWSYNEAIRSREDLVDASVLQFRGGRVAEAAVLMQQANEVASRPDQSWPFLFPWHAAVLRVTGVFSGIHVSKEYRAAETAYLFRMSGQHDRAGPYYERLQKQRGRTTEQLDVSASAFLRSASAFQEEQVKE